jgi:hypothetical protein
MNENIQINRDCEHLRPRLERAVGIAFVQKTTHLFESILLYDILDLHGLHPSFVVWLKKPSVDDLNNMQ